MGNSGANLFMVIYKGLRVWFHLGSLSSAMTKFTSLGHDTGSIVAVFKADPPTFWLHIASETWKGECPDNT